MVVYYLLIVAIDIYYHIGIVISVIYIFISQIVFALT